MNILICDDKKEDANSLAALLDKSDFDVKTVIFANSKQALDYIYSGKNADACFLDIVMPEMNGIELAEKLRENNFDNEIVFLTESNNFACQSYRIQAFDYLLKPPTLENVKNVISKLKNAKKNFEQNCLFIKIQGIAKRVLFRDISYVEAINHTVHIKLLDNSAIKMRTTFGKIAENLLCDSRFARCHRSYIINVGEIASVANQKVTMNNGTNIPISRGFSQVKDEMMRWMFKENGK